MREQAPQRELRERVSRSRDPRAMSVRNDLFAAAARLGQLRADVTVTSLVREAQVSRSVFYVHFADLTDFARAMQRQHLDALVESTGAPTDRHPADVTLDGLRALVAHFDTHRDLYRAIEAIGGVQAVGAELARAIEGEILRHIERFCALPAGLRADTAATFIAAGMTAALARELTAEAPCDLDALAPGMLSLIPPWLYGVSDAGNEVAQ